MSLLFSVISFTCLHSQNDKKIFLSGGYSIFSDFGMSPVFTEKVIKQNYLGSAEYNYYSRVNYLSMMNYHFKFRAILSDLSSDVHLSLNTGLSFGLTLASDLSANRQFMNGSVEIEDIQTGIMKVNLPLFLSTDFQLGTNTDCGDKNYFSIGFGAELNKVPIFSFESFYSSDERMTSLWVQPIVSFSYSFCNKNSDLYEVNVVSGMGRARDYPIDGSGYYEADGLENYLTKSRAFTVRLSVTVTLFSK